jgi:hypothetical protein
MLSVVLLAHLYDFFDSGAGPSQLLKRMLVPLLDVSYAGLWGFARLCAK